jgi:hypothetical protein
MTNYRAGWTGFFQFLPVTNYRSYKRFWQQKVFRSLRNAPDVSDIVQRALAND